MNLKKLYVITLVLMSFAGAVYAFYATALWIGKPYHGSKLVSIPNAFSGNGAHANYKMIVKNDTLVGWEKIGSPAALSDSADTQENSAKMPDPGTLAAKRPFY